MGVNAPDVVASDTVQPDSADVVIIGGGIVGVCAAYFLAARGQSVVLCEKGKIAGEQSGRNWGWVRQMGRDPAEIPLSMHSLALWRELNEKAGADTGFRQGGITYVCETPQELAEYENWLPTGAANGVRSELVRGDRLAELLPGLDRRFVGGLYTESDGWAEPTMAASAIANASRRLGAAVLTECAVRGLETEAGHLAYVVTERGPIRCKTAILAAGAWSRLFAGALGVDFPQLRIVGSVMRIEAPAGISPMPVGGSNFGVRPRLDGGYNVAMRNNNVAPITTDSFRLFADFFPALVKQRRELRLRFGRDFFEDWSVPRRWKLDQQSPFERVRILEPKPDEAANREGLKHLSSAFPAFAGARITNSWAGVIDVTPDAVPVIDWVEKVPGLFLASGFSGHGFGLGPGAGHLAADLVSGDAPVVDPAPFRLGRFRRAER